MAKILILDVFFDWQQSIKCSREQYLLGAWGLADSDGPAV